VVAAGIGTIAVVAGRAEQAFDEPEGRATPAFGRSNLTVGLPLFQRRASWFTQRRTHVVLALGALLAVIRSAVDALGESKATRPPTIPIDVGLVVVAAATLVLLVVLALSSWVLPSLFTMRSEPPGEVRRPNGTATAAAVLAVALSHFFLSGLVLWVIEILKKHADKEAGALQPGREFALVDTYLLVAALWLLVAIVIAAVRRKVTRSDSPSDGQCDAWDHRRSGAEATAAIIHKVDVAAVWLAAAFVAVGVGVGLARIHHVDWSEPPWKWAVDAPDTESFAFSVAAWAVPIATLFVLIRIRNSATDNRLQRFIGQAWDVLSFWPRRFHPFAVRPYSHVAVPALRDRIVDLTADDGALVVAAHSQGSVLAVAALCSVPEDVRRRVGLITYGSHVAGIYRRVFPSYFNGELVAEVKGSLSEGDAAGWHNFYRFTDPIGVPMFDVSSPRDHGLADPTTLAARDAKDDPAPPLERDLERCDGLAVHSYYRNEQELKSRVRAMKDLFHR